MTTLDLTVDWAIKNGGVPKQTKDDLGGIGTASNQADIGFGKLISTLAAVTGAVVAVKKGFEFAEEGAQVQQLKSSFDLMNESVFKSPALLEDMSAAVRGTVSDVDLMRGLLTLTAGASDDMAQRFAEAAPQLLEIAKASNKLNPALGDTAFLYESLSLGIKRNSPLILDNLGIVVKVGEANQKYASQIGKTVEQLTAEEKSMALLNATLESGNRIIKQAGGNVDSAADSYAALRVELEETTSSLKQMAADGLTPLISSFNDALSGAREFKDGLKDSFDLKLDQASTIQDLQELAEVMRATSRVDVGEATEQMHQIAAAVAAASEDAIYFDKNLTAVLGTAGGIKTAGADFREFYEEFRKTEAIKAQRTALEQNLKAVDDNRSKLNELADAAANVAANLSEATVFTERSTRTTYEATRAYDGWVEAAHAMSQARLDRIAADTEAKAEADRQAAIAAEEHAAAMQRQQEELARVNATTGDYFTTIAASGDALLSMTEYGLQAADAMGANALQLAAYTEQAGIADDASKNLAQSLGQAAADAAAADFARTGDLDAYMTRLQELQSTIDNFPSISEVLRNQEQSQVMAEESPFFKIEEDAPAAIQLLEEVTTAGVTGFGNLKTTGEDAFVTVGGAVGDMNGRLSETIAVLDDVLLKIRELPDTITLAVDVPVNVTGLPSGANVGAGNAAANAGFQ